MSDNAGGTPHGSSSGPALRGCPSSSSEACPYGSVVKFVSRNNDDAVNMIGHRLEFVPPDSSIIFRQSPPGFFHHLAGGVGHHPVIDDFAKQFFSALYANGHEIMPGPGIITFLKSVCLSGFHLSRIIPCHEPVRRHNRLHHHIGTWNGTHICVPYTRTSRSQSVRKSSLRAQSLLFLVRKFTCANGRAIRARLTLTA